MCLQMDRCSRTLFVGLLAMGLAGQVAAQDASVVQQPAHDSTIDGKSAAPVDLVGTKQAFLFGISPNSPVWEKMFGAEPKKVKAAYLGVSTSRLTPAMRSQLSLPAGIGLVVDVVDKDSPGAKAGLKQYDVLHKLNDQILVNLEQLSILVRTFKPGDEVAFTVIRQAKPITLKAKLIEKEVYDLVYVGTLDGGAGTTQAGVGGEAIMAMPATQNYSGAVTGVYDLTGSRDVPGKIAANITFSDGEHSIQITSDKGKPWLVATDKNGKEVFKGPIVTEADLKAVPEAIRKKLELVQRGIRIGGGDSSPPLKGKPEPKSEALK